MSPTLLEGLLIILVIIWMVVLLPRLYKIISFYMYEYRKEFKETVEEVNEREKEDELSKVK